MLSLWRSELDSSGTSETWMGSEALGAAGVTGSPNPQGAGVLDHQEVFGLAARDTTHG